MNSILTTIKKMLDLEETNTDFDVDIIVLINSALMTLTQLGIGPNMGFTITSSAETWASFLGTTTELEGIKAYIYLKVRTVFDPPTSATVLEAYNKSITELEVRLNIQAETPTSTLD